MGVTCAKLGNRVQGRSSLPGHHPPCKLTEIWLDPKKADHPWPCALKLSTASIVFRTSRIRAS